jgi:ATP phosphoribosyltransferase regulatory subunit
VLQRARNQLPPLSKIITALDELQQLADIMPSLPIGFDLSDLRGYNYHSGIVFAAYHQSASSAIALGGRYDEVGAAYGRARPATGFSMDLREIARLMPLNVNKSAILAPWDQDDQLNAEVIRLRDQGEIVVRELPGHEGTWQETGCDRQLVRRGDKWLIEPLSE